MTGDAPDFITRIKSALPTRWFPDDTPVLDSVLSGLAIAWSALYALLAYVRLQSRIATATTSFLEGASTDFFADRLPRRIGESDDSFRVRLQQALRREHATRFALLSTLQDLTGHIPIIFEPSRITDTGAYATASMGYAVAGAWGSLELPFQVFVTARRPQGVGIANIAGYATGGPLARASLAQISGQVTDADIAAAVTAVMPTASTAWLRITN
ncbi:hypothetical protein [Acidisphaera sp. L21]|jgi:hypothetical protein|uniref:hypothetical protein n=1 Tax=Acidisphaera sp. L21 TaxID=1641851 RepID=UPI00131D8FF4|nr:hypothetical protein [Acidisphaera sp. L21]